MLHTVVGFLVVALLSLLPSKVFGSNAYTFGGTNTGFYYDSSGIFYFKSNGTKVASLLASGYFGIGDMLYPTARLDVINKFRVDDAGDLIEIKDVAYTWPSSQGAASTMLTNDGSGNLSWTPASISGSGAAQRMAFWTGAGSLGSEVPNGSSRFTYSSAVGAKHIDLQDEAGRNLQINVGTGSYLNGDKPYIFSTSGYWLLISGGSDTQGGLSFRSYNTFWFNNHDGSACSLALHHTDGVPDYVSIFPAGSAATPSLNWIEDSNTGFYGDGSDALMASTNGTERFRIDANGQIGIGTTVPTQRLHVVGLGGGTPTGGWPTGGVAVFQRNSVAGDPLAISLISGADSQATLHFGDGDDSDIGGITYNNANNTFNFRVDNVLTAQLWSNRLSLFAGGSAGTPVIQLGDDPNTGIFHPADDTLSISTSGVERARWLAGGNLFIGNYYTITPGDEAISLMGDGASRNISLNLSADSAAQPIVYFRKSRGSMGGPSTVLSGDYVGEIAMGGYNSASWVDHKVRILGSATQDWTGAANGTKLSFYITPNGSTTPEEKLVIDALGYVGIGVSTPDTKLHVKSATPEFRVESTTSGNATLSLKTNSTKLWGMHVDTDGELFFSDDLNTRIRVARSTGYFGLGTAAPTSRLDVLQKFRVDDNGDLVEIKDVPYSWPSPQGGAGTVLANDGSGNLSWSPQPKTHCEWLRPNSLVCGSGAITDSCAVSEIKVGTGVLAANTGVFDKSVSDYGVIYREMPSNFIAGSDITFRIWWGTSQLNSCNYSGGGDDVCWTVGTMSIAEGDSEFNHALPANDVAVGDTCTANDDYYKTGTITITSANHGLVAGGLAAFVVTRDLGASVCGTDDNINSDLNFHGLLFCYGINETSDGE